MKINRILSKNAFLILLALSLVVTACSPKVYERESELYEDLSWAQDAVVYEVNVRQSTKEGTFDAFREEHLDRLADMGIEVLWLMPIHPISSENRIGSLGSYYAVQDYKGVNREFGDLEDLKELVDAAHDRGMKVILDWVANHTGWDHVWIEDHPDWYTQIDGKIVSPQGTGWLDVADLDFNNTKMRQEMIKSMVYWVEEADVDGFRCDYAAGVPKDFWDQATSRLMKVKPVFMLAEDNTSPQLLEYAFVANYNWDLLGVMNQTAGGTNNVKKISDTLKAYESLPTGSYQMNFITNHDENSWNGTEYERLGQAVDLMAALTFVMPGIPLIYSGQEAAFNERLEFFDKDEIQWGNYEKEDFYARLIDLKQDNPALFHGIHGGDLTVHSASKNQVLAFTRASGDNKVLYIANINSEGADVQLPFLDYDHVMTDAFSGEVMDINKDALFELSPFEYRIYILD